jgi:hypothetical protein
MHRRGFFGSLLAVAVGAVTPIKPKEQLQTVEQNNGHTYNDPYSMCCPPSHTHSIIPIDPSHSHTHHGLYTNNDQYK